MFGSVREETPRWNDSQDVTSRHGIPREREIGTNLAVQVAEEVRAHFPEQLLGTAIPRNVRISEAPSYQQTVLTYDPTSAGAVAYREAAAEIAGRGAPAAKG